MPNKPFDDIRTSVGDLFMKSPVPGIITGTAAVGRKAQELARRYTKGPSANKSNKITHDIELKPERRSTGRSITSRRR